MIFQQDCWQKLTLLRGEGWKWLMIIFGSAKMIQEQMKEAPRVESFWEWKKAQYQNQGQNHADLLFWYKRNYPFRIFSSRNSRLTFYECLWQCICDKDQTFAWASGFCIMIMHLSRWSSVKQSLADNQINALEHPTHKVLPHETLHVSNMRILLKESHFEFIEDIHTM